MKLLQPLARTRPGPSGVSVLLTTPSYLSGHPVLGGCSSAPDRRVLVFITRTLIIFLLFPEPVC